MFPFCRPVSSKKRFLPFRKLDDNFSFSLFGEARAIPVADWERVSGANCLFLNTGYLALLETCGYAALTCRYVIVYQNGQPCGIIYYQVCDFKAGAFASLLAEKSEGSGRGLFEKYIHKNSNEVLMRLITCGNNLVNGEYGFVFTPIIDKQRSHDIVITITDILAKEERLAGVISAVQIKDFYNAPGSLFTENKYATCVVEPNMVLDIPPGVNNLAAYVALFSKKYRNRAKSIFKGMDGIRVSELSTAEIAQNETQLYALYNNIFEQARFKINKLPANYFSETKRLFNSRFKVLALFHQEQIVAFASFFFMPDNSLEAHYIGLDYAFNEQHNLYQNILYLLIEEALKQQLHRINFGRTAAEIKTTVGAKPQNLMCCIRPQNTFSRIVQKPFMALLQPAPYTPRNPFKEQAVLES